MVQWTLSKKHGVNTAENFLFIAYVSRFYSSRYLISRRSRRFVPKLFGGNSESIKFHMNIWSRDVVEAWTNRPKLFKLFFADGTRGNAFNYQEIPKNNSDFRNFSWFVLEYVTWNENNKTLNRNFTWRKKKIRSNGWLNSLPPTPIINTSDVFVSLYYEQKGSK